jgi:catechol 2,3-dioxygenase-like lactoylglutathione lyase family enzyme
LADLSKISGAGQEQAGAMHPTFAVIEIVTQDMAASLAFYSKLGLAVPPGSEQAPHVEAMLPGGLKLVWDTVDTIRSFDKEWEPPSGGGHRMALAFQCATPAEVDAVYAELTSAGHAGHLQPWDAFWGMRYASVLDPDGNPVDLFADLGQADTSDSTE